SKGGSRGTRGHPSRPGFAGHLRMTGFLAAIEANGNDLEPPAISLQPVIASVLAALRALPACRLVRMSGSAATCFGLFNSARAVLGHQRDRQFEVGVGRLAVLERAPPKDAFALGAAAERQHHRQRDLAGAEIIADVLAELGRLAAVVERIVDELEGDAEIHAKGATGRLLVFGAR